MGYWEYEKQMIDTMKQTIVDTVKEQISKGWSLEQIKTLFFFAVDEAMNELQEEN